MNAIKIIIFLGGIFSLSSALQAQTSSAADSSPLTSNQNDFFDKLLKLETQLQPESARMLEEAPIEEAAQMVETEDSEITGQPNPVLSPVTGTYIQLSREWTTLTTEDWAQVLDIIQDAGLRKIIIQWTALPEIAFFEPAPEQFTETHPVINRLFEASSGRDLEIVLGLYSDPDYWQLIETRNDVRDVYFRVINTHDLRIQEALIEEFGEDPHWTGYYIAVEIDDINWREPADEGTFHQFLLRAGRIIRERDDQRTVSISSFFRKRTAPSTYATNLSHLMSSTSITQLWIQDGVGVYPLSRSLIEPYYQILAQQFAGISPQLGSVVELFEMTSKPSEPFTAQPALAARVLNQLENASLLGGPIMLFSLFDYADPRKGGAQEEIYEVIREWNQRIAPAPTAAASPSTPPSTESSAPDMVAPSPPAELPDAAETQIKDPGPPKPDFLTDPTPRPKIEPITGLRPPETDPPAKDAGLR
ncbi:MAG: DUF4434 domain-containing protein [Puniceicoccales bacterium]